MGKDTTYFLDKQEFAKKKINIQDELPLFCPIFFSEEKILSPPNFCYAGSIEEFIAPVSGEYKLECWGAGLENQEKFCGGYSVGITSSLLLTSDQLFVCVGGEGKSNNGRIGGKGGYNGGGDGGNGSPVNEKGNNQNYNGGYGGGGATHIAKKADLLIAFSSNYKTDLYLVAGGSGGMATAVINNNGSVAIPYGGGENGGPPCSSYNLTGASYREYAKATQESGWLFGQGQTGISKTTYGGANGAEGNGGGGGGLYGGFSPQIRGATGTNAYGGGGSGYVNPSLLTNAKTVTGNQSFPSIETGHSGNGACAITQISFQ